MPSAEIYEDQAEETTPPETPEAQPRGPDGKFVKSDPPQTHQEPAKPSHPDWLVQQARDYGIDDVDISELSTDQLNRAVTREYRRLQAAQSRQEPKPEPKPQAKVEDDELDLVDEHGKRVAPDELLHPAVAGFLRKLAKSHKDETKALKEQLESYKVNDQKRQQMRATAIIDKAFASIPDLAGYFGTGAGADLSKDKAKSAEFNRRIAVLNLCGADFEADSPQQIISKIRNTALMICPTQAPPAPKEPAPEPKKNGKPRPTEADWANGSVAPANRLREDEPDGDRKAKKNLYAKIGGEPPSLDDDDDEFFE